MVKNKRNVLIIEKFLNKNSEKCINKIINRPYMIELKSKGKYSLLKYNENLGCDFNKKIVRECRSLILKDNIHINGNRNGKKLPKFKRVAVPFFKFFNYTEHNSKKITKDFRNKKLYGYEKIDGSIIIMWYDDNKWHISTSGNIDAYDAPLPNHSVFKTYGDLFKYCLDNTQININKLDKRCTYMFELISPYNRIVVNYDNCEIYHIGTRNNITLKENFKYIGVQQPKSIEFNGLQEAINYVKNITRNDKNYEGIVVRDNNYNRLKIKTEMWFNLSKLKNNGIINTNRILEMIKSGADNEFISYFPEFTEQVNHIKNNIKLFREEIKKEILKANYEKSKKEYYEYVNNIMYCNILIKAFNIQISKKENNELDKWIDEQINNIPKRKYIQIIENYK